jgi:hypothetical protein
MGMKISKANGWRHSLRVLGALTLFGSLVSGCVVYEETVQDDAAGSSEAATGGNPWDHGDNVSCAGPSDCGSGEICVDGTCQMQRCGDTYKSTPPLGTHRYFGVDGEFAVISDGTFVDGIESADGSYLSSWDLTSSGANVVDVAGGNLTPERPHSIAVALEFSNMVQLKTPKGISELDVGLWPMALAVGDTDADGLDELVAFAEDGSIAVCDVDQMKCLAGSIADVTGKDVAVADIDGDGFAEPVFLLEADGKTQVVAWNTNADDTGEESTVGWGLNFPARALAAGDVMGDKTAELALLEDGGWWGWTDDKLHIITPANGQILMTRKIDGHTKDIALGDRDSDDQVEIAVLRDGQKIELIKAVNDELVSLGTFPIGVGKSADRVSFVDWNGDSASGKLVGQRELIAGGTVPIAVLMVPPYPHGVAVGADDNRASAAIGGSESSSTSASETVSLTMGIAVGFGAETGIFKAKVGVSLDQSLSQSTSNKKSQSVGARYAIKADPMLHGTGYAAVVLSCGCFHRYQYETVDPNKIIGGSGQTADIYVPVGGQTQLWSTKRYNAMAEAVGNLPIVNVPVKVGDPSSYPTEVVALDGSPIPKKDLVFDNIPSFQVSDVGSVSFRLSSSESTTNSVAMSTSIGVSTSLGIGPASVDTNLGLGVTQGYSVTVGKDAFFSGAVPPITDDPSTPEDEFTTHRYTFQPVIYRQHYTDQDGSDAAYYVMHYAAWK